MEIKNIDTDLLIPYKKNTKKHDETQIANVAESIKQYGFVQPLVIDKNNVVVIGHCRLLAAKEMKMKQVPCVCVDDLTDEQVKALRIVDNKSNESPWDFDLLAEELAEIDLGDFDFDFGFDTDTDDDAEIVEDEAPEFDEENEPITKLGDIWQLGRHRLMCGDSTDKETVELLMNDNKADMVFTDPPYGVNIVQNQTVGGDKPFGTTRNDNGAPVSFGTTSRPKSREIVPATKYMPIKGDDTTNTARLNYKIIKEISENQIIFGGNYFTDFLPPSRCWIVWDKGVPEGAFFCSRRTGVGIKRCER